MFVLLQANRLITRSGFVEREGIHRVEKGSSAQARSAVAVRRTPSLQSGSD